jgi:hypothetical protein
VTAEETDPAASLRTLASSPGRTGWALSVCVAAREAGGSFRSQRPAAPAIRVPGAPAADPERAADEAARRARGKVRRYCAANRLNRLGTLTYRGAGCHDPQRLRADVAAFFRELRSLTGGRSFPYLWTAEWHKSGHGLHVHFAVGQFIHRSQIDAAWGNGFIHIKLLGDLPVGSGTVAEARKAAGYLAKYVGKDFDANRSKGLHRYEVAEGFQPAIQVVWSTSRDGVIREASALVGGRPEVVWVSDDVEGWMAPPALWLQWRG